jgi:hypothetical protein
MALATYADLKTAVTAWMARGNVAGQAADFITLAEAGLNRELPAVETDADLTGTEDSRRIDISALSVVEPIALFLAQAGYDEVEIARKADGTFPYLTTSGQPAAWAMDGTNIDFDRPCDQAYPFRFRYRQRFSLTDDAGTNWLLTNHPDVYLAATLIWGGVFTRNTPFAATYATILKEGIPAVRNIIAQSKRGVLSVDPMLVRIGNRSTYDGYTDT